MTRFIYQARNKSGELIKGEVEAASHQEASKGLVNDGFTPISIKKSGLAFDLSKLLEGGSVSTKELSLFFRQLGVIYSAGVPFFESLQAIEAQMSNKVLKKTVRQIREDVEGGSTFFNALSKFPKLFSPLMITMIEAGEKGGILGEVLEKINIYLETEMRIKNKISAALRYPIMVIATFLLAFVIAVVFIIPKFSNIFKSLGAELPLPTRILLGINFVAVHYWWLVIIASFASYYLFKSFRGTPFGRLKLDQFLLVLPVWGEVIIKVSLSRIFFMLSSLINSGISIVYGLEVTSTAADNVVIAHALGRIKEKVMGGAKLADSMKEFGFFPPLAIQMISVGEKSGSLDTMMSKSADYFNEETDFIISNLTSLIEPFLIFFLAFMVMLLAMGIYLPMWGLMSAFSK